MQYNNSTYYKKNIMSDIIPYSSSQSVDNPEECSQYLNNRAENFKLMLHGLVDIFSTVWKLKYKPLENELLNKPLENELLNYDSQLKPLENQFWDYGELKKINNIDFMLKEMFDILFLLFLCLFCFLVLLLIFAFLLGELCNINKYKNKNLIEKRNNDNDKSKKIK